MRQMQGELHMALVASVGSEVSGNPGLRRGKVGPLPHVAQCLGSV